MSKTLEELGYEKNKGDWNIVIYMKKGEKGPYHNYFISFDKEDRIVEAYESLGASTFSKELAMEELKAIYKWCEDKGWIDE